MFLIFHELRADVLPVDDIGLQKAIALHYNDGERLDAAAMRELARDVAAVAQRRDVVPVALARPDSGRVLTGMAAAAHPYATPHARRRPRRARQRSGLRGDGRLLALGSYENRVYQIGIEDAPPVVAKFYRPGRWSDAQILEEHAFVAELAAREIPVVAPLARRRRDAARVTAASASPSIRDAAAARPSSRIAATLEWMGRFLGRIHAVGARAPFRHRPALDVETFGVAPRDWLLAHDFIPPDLQRRVAQHRRAGARRRAPRFRARRRRRRHCGCTATATPATCCGPTHGPHFVDFDDARMGPAVQDLWMLLVRRAAPR